MNHVFLRTGLGLFLMTLLSSTTHAEMYKWVDEDGVTQYTQTPPPQGIEGKEIKPKTGISAEQSSKNYEKVKEQLESLVEKGEEKDAETQDEEVSDEEYEQQVQKACDSARKSYQSFQRPRVNLKNPDGTMRVASEPERQAGLQRAQEAMKKYCK